MCPRRSRPRSAAKQGRSFRVAPINARAEVPARGGLGSKNGPSSARVCSKGSGPRSAAKQRRSFRVPPINRPEACVPKAVEATFCSKTGPFFSCGSNKLCPNPIWWRPHLANTTNPANPSLENGPSSARVCPSGSGPRSAAKQRRSFRVPPINHPESRVPKAVEATFCSKTGPFFSCDSNKLCPNPI